VAETFAVCWRKLDRVPENALPWLYAVARKTLANERRKRSREAALTDLPAPPLEHDHTLSLALGELKETDREVLRLVAWEGLLLREAAAVLGCSTVAARVRFHRAKRRLAARLEALEPSRCPRPHPEGAVR